MCAFINWKVSVCDYPLKKKILEENVTEVCPGEAGFLFLPEKSLR